MSRGKEYILGVDIGTSSSKALAFSLNGQVAVQHQIKYDTQHPKPGYSEQDPKQLLQAVTGVIKEVVSKMDTQPLCVSFSSAMHSIVAVDGKGEPLSPLLVWSDSRSREEIITFKKEGDAYGFYKHTGTPIHPMSPFSKLLWWKKNDAETFRKAAKFISIPEYIFSQFFHSYEIGYSLASATGLFDHRKLGWYQPALDYIGLSSEKLSTPVPSTHICRGLKSDFARKTGLDVNTPFVVAAGDGCLANLGTGVTENGEMAVTIGTSGAVRLFGYQPIEPSEGAGKGGIFNYLLTAGEYISGGAINNGGVLLDWYRLHFMKTEKKPIGYQEIIQEAFRADPGCNGLLFLPYIYGERAPIWDAHARGCFLGISHLHEKQDFARAVIEGICYDLYHTAAIIKNNIDYEIKDIYVSGGFTRSRRWVQLLTDLFEKEVKVSGHGDASTVGAAILGMKALGIIEHWKEAEKHIPITQTFTPHSETSKIYQRNFGLYARMYDTFAPAMHEIASWQEKGFS